MPLIRYFVFVGSALLLSLFGLDWCLPRAIPEPIQADFERPAIRISSTAKLPEPVVIDTSLPTIAPVAPISEIAELSPKAEVDDQAHIFEPSPAKIVSVSPKPEPAEKRLPVKKIVAARAVADTKPQSLSKHHSSSSVLPATRLSLLEAIKERFGRGFLRLN